MFASAAALINKQNQALYLTQKTVECLYRIIVMTI